MPGVVTDEPVPYHGQVVLWIDPVGGRILSHELVRPADLAAGYARSLATALADAQQGPAGRPARLRIAAAEFASAVSRAAGSDIEVVVAPIPEFDEVRAHLEADARAWLRPPDAPQGALGDFTSGSYFQGGLVTTTHVEPLFRAARFLQSLAPWDQVGDDQPIRVDIPALGVQGAVIAVMGGLGECFGFILFPDLNAYHATGDVVDAAERGISRIDLGGSVLVFELEHRDALPERAREEIAAHRWPDVQARYPWVSLRARDGAAMPVDQRQYAIAAAIASTLGTFCMRNEMTFADDAIDASIDPVSVTIESTGFPNVRYTFPCESFDEFTDEFESREATPTPHRAPRVPGRNEPCHCGSGRKYKHCHLGQDEQAAKPTERAIRGVEIIEAIRHEADARWGAAWRRHRRDFKDADAAAQIAREWSVFHFQVEGTTAAAAFLDRHRAQLAPSERDWIEQQLRATLSVWEVLSVDRGTGFVARDLLLGSERRIHDRQASECLAARDAFLGRVLQEEDRWIIQGVHPRILVPLAARHVVEAVRKRLRLRRDQPADADAIRPTRFARFLIAQWEDAVLRMDEERRNPPRMTTTEGGDLILCELKYGFDPSRHAELIAALDALAAASQSDIERTGDRGAAVYTFYAPGAQSPIVRAQSVGRSILGQLHVTKDEAVLFTNARERLARLTGVIRAATGDLLRERDRSEIDAREQYLQSLKQESSGDRRAAARLETVPPPEIQEALRQVKRESYRNWLDEPIPALGGRTPRHAARLASGRRDLDLLLRDIENHEARLPEWERFDFSVVRAELGLPR